MIKFYTTLLLSCIVSLTWATDKIRFIENKGQMTQLDESQSAEICYIGQSQQATIYFAANTLSWVFSDPSDARNLERIDMTYLGVDEEAEISGIARDGSRVNYYANSKSVELEAFSQLQYKNLYSGIDLQFYSNVDGLKYDYLVAPAAKGKHIRWQYAGAKKLEIMPNGSLKVYTQFDQIIESIPKVYFKEKPALEVPEVCYQLLDNDIVELVIEPYEEHLTLVVDPLATWGTYLGGTQNDYGHGLVRDGDFVYLAGETQSSPFPTTTGVTQTAAGGSRDAFLSKFTVNGDLVWSTYFGGSGSDVAEDIDVSNGAIYLAGHTTGNLPVTAGAHQSTYGNNTDAFLAKFNDNGILEWATYYGGGELDEGYDVAVDNAGNIVMTGATETSEFPVSNIIATTGAYQTSKGGNEDAFVVKFTSAGIRIWGTYVGGSDTERGYNIDTDSNNDIVITGETYGGSSFNEFPVGSSAGYTAFQTTQGGGFGDKDAFIFKLSPDGASRRFGTFFGGENIERGYGIAVDPMDNIIITGNVNGDDLPVTFGTIQFFWGGGGSWGNSDAFLAKFDATGDRLWSTYYGGGDYDLGFSVHAPDNNKIIIAGETASSNLPGLSGCLSCSGTFCGFVMQVSSDGSTIEFATYLGGSGSFNSGTDVQGDDEDNLFVTGYTTSSDYPVGGNTYQSSLAGNADAFLGLVNSVECLVLPLDLIEFAANPQDNDVLLKWLTANEVNVSHFEIEQSIDGIDFMKIAELPASANTDGGGGASYDYLDVSPWTNNTNQLYYRLKMVDEDQRFSYSPTVTVGRALSDYYLDIHPNPARESLSISLTLDQAEWVQFTMLDIHGRAVKQFAVNELEDYQTTLDISDLHAGTYILKVETREKAQFRKVIIH